MSRKKNPSADFFNTPTHAVIDIGSNTVRLVVFGGASRAPTQLWNEKVTAKLGKNVPETGNLSRDAMDVALKGLQRFAILLKGLQIDDVETVATAAVRDAENGPHFLQEVRELGLNPRLLSGEEEAMIGALGVISAFPDADGVVADLGGGSLELTEIGPFGSLGATSLPLGTLRLASMQKLGPEKYAKQVDKVLKQAGWKRDVGKPLYLVGGTFRAMANYKLRSDAGVLDDPHGLRLTNADAYKLAKLVSRATPEELKKVNGISSMRAEVLPHAAGLLRMLLAELEPSGVYFSSYGLREGLLYQRLDPIARMQTPLLAGVAAFAAPRGGRPSLAARMAAWTVDVLPRDGESYERLRLAAAMLAMASMQIEPNLRCMQAVGWALHKRWIHLSTEHRACIAAALAANCGHQNWPAD